MKAKIRKINPNKIMAFAIPVLVVTLIGLYVFILYKATNDKPAQKSSLHNNPVIELVNTDNIIDLQKQEDIIIEEQSEIDQIADDKVIKLEEKTMVYDANDEITIDDGEDTGEVFEETTETSDETIRNTIGEENTNIVQEQTPHTIPEVEHTPVIINEPAIIPVSNLIMSVNRTETARYKTGESGSVAVTIFPSNATDKSYEITSSNPTVLSVTPNGHFTANAEGIVTITVVAKNGIKREVVVTVLDMSSLAEQVINLTNNERTNNSLSTLQTCSEILNPAVSTRVNEIKNSFSHTRPDGRKQSTAYEDFGGSYNGSYKETGENIAAGHISSAAVFNAWINSMKNKANIMDAKYTHIGVSVDMDENGRLYWVQTFYG